MADKRLTYIRAMNAKVAVLLFVDSLIGSSMKAPLGNSLFASFILDKCLPGRFGESLFGGDMTDI